MTTREFIGLCVRGNIVKNRIVSSVIYNKATEVIYSYGSHYPLLFKIGGKWILNDRGYSATTSKHISWASAFADYVVSLKDGGGSYGYRGVEAIAENVLISSKEEISGLNVELDSLKRHGTQREAALFSRKSLIEKTRDYVEGMLLRADPDHIPF